MYIYNVTINIDENVHDEWLVWMRDIHIPDMLATGKFLEARMCRVVVEEEFGGITYSIQYKTDDKATLEKYYREDAVPLRKDGLERFGERFVAFRTELEVISEQLPAPPQATEYLFTYGTLKEEAVQVAVFSRKVRGIRDRLVGYTIAEEKVAGRYPTIRKTGDLKDSVEGELLILGGDDLNRTDSYEGQAYRRIRVTLSSGTLAWVYLEK